MPCPTIDELINFMVNENRLEKKELKKKDCRNGLESNAKASIKQYSNLALVYFVRDRLT